MKTLSDNLTPQIKVTLTKDGQPVIDEKAAEVLMAIRETNSIGQAAEKTQTSYKGIWNHIKWLEKSLSSRVVETVSGGLGGGATKLTLLGESLLEDYLIAQTRCQNFVQMLTLKPPDLVIIGSQCPALELLVAILRKKATSLAIKLLNVGSLRGLAALEQGEGDIAGIHILDPVTAMYNIPIFRRRGLDKNFVLVRGYRRVQGLIFSSKNPKSIAGLEDLLSKGIVFINRSRGSGTRLLFDYHLKLLSRKLGLKSFGKLSRSIRGYDTEARSHHEVVLAILQGRAHVGLGLQCMAARHGLGFIPITEECFDLVINKQKLNTVAVRTFLKQLKSEEFRNLVRRNLQGIEILPETGQIIAV